MIWGRIRERRRHLALLGGAVASAALWAAFFASTWPTDPLPVVALVVVAAGLTWWTVLHPARLAYDLTTPVTVATGVLAGPGAALRVLVLQGVLLSLVDGFAHRRSPAATTTNVGLFATWQVPVAIGIRFLLERTGDPTSATIVPFALGLATVTAVGTALNYWSVRLGSRYVYGPPREAPEPTWGVHLRDIAASTLLGVAVWSGRVSVWVPVVALGLAAVVAFDLVRGARERAEQQTRRLRDRIQQAERAGLEGHSARVAEMIDRLVADERRRVRRRAVAAAWCHSIAVSGRPGRCAGVPADPEHVELMRALPSGLLIENTINSIVGGYVGPNADPTAAWIAAACALDSTRHHPAAVARRHISSLLHISAETLAIVSRVEEMLRREEPAAG